MIQEELPPLTKLISDDILSKRCHVNLGPILNIYRVTFVFGFFFLNFSFNDNYKLHHLNAFIVTKKNKLISVDFTVLVVQFCRDYNTFSKMPPSAGAGIAYSL
jgi:hypothetical protein